MISTYIIAAVIGILYPIYLFSTYKETNKKVKTVEGHRLVEYKLTIAHLWIGAFLVLGNFYIYQQPSLNFFPTFSTTGIVLTLLVIGAIIFQYTQLKVTPENVDSWHEKLKTVLFFAPGTKKEFNWFVVVSFTAGICEEIVFRLFLFHFLTPYTGIILAILIPNLIFASTHIWSGASNIFGSFILGLVFSSLYYFTGNIWIPVLLHIGVDVIHGILGYRVKSMLSQKVA